MAVEEGPVTPPATILQNRALG